MHCQPQLFAPPTACAPLPHATGKAHTRLCPTGIFASEVTFAPRAGAAAEDDGYVLMVLYDSNRHGSDVVVVDARNFEVQTP